MARESFEDQEVGDMLNEYFISIKVDREERPDIDQLYMSVCQAMTGQGGWPLTILMTPEKKPFYAGTYFPRERNYGRHGIIDILQQVETKWRTEEAEVREVGEKIVRAIQLHAPVLSEGQPSADLLDQGYAALRETFDRTFGGFGTSPKFPSAHQLSYLLRYAASHPEQQPEALYMV